MTLSTDEDRSSVGPDNSDGIPSNSTTSQALSSISAGALPSDSSGPVDQPSEQPSALAEATSYPQLGSVLEGTAHDPTESYNYVIWPWEGTKKEATDRIYQKILSLVKDPSAIYTSDTLYLGVNFWRADLTDEQVLTLEAMPEVGALERPDRETGDPCI